MEENQSVLNKNIDEHRTVGVRNNETKCGGSSVNRTHNQSEKIEIVDNSKEILKLQADDIKSGISDREYTSSRNEKLINDITGETQALLKSLEELETFQKMNDTKTERTLTSAEGKNMMTNNETVDKTNLITEDITSLIGTIFHSPVRDMQFDNEVSANTTQFDDTGTRSKREDIVISALGDAPRIIDLPPKIERPPRRSENKLAKLHRRNSRSFENLTSISSSSERKRSVGIPVSESNFYTNLHGKLSVSSSPARKWGSSESLTIKGRKEFLNDTKFSTNLNKTSEVNEDVSNFYVDRSQNEKLVGEGRRIEVNNENLCDEASNSVSNEEMTNCTDLLKEISSEEKTENKMSEENVNSFPESGSWRQNKTMWGKNIGVKEKRTIGSLRSSLEKKVGFMERMLEDRVEKIWEENVEKHPWLVPIESWIIDHCKSEKKAVEAEQKGSDVEQSFDFKFTAATKEEVEPKIESRIIQHLKKRRRIASSRRERSSFGGKSNKAEKSSMKTVDVDQSVPLLSEKDVLEIKDAKQSNYDLFDKLKDNVKGKMEDIHRYFQRTNRLADVNRRLKSQIWSSVVTIVLVQARNLLPMDSDGLSDPYVKFRLGTEKYKSKVVNKTLNPIWLEQFDLHLYEDPYLGQELEVTVWDRDKSHQDDLMGKTVIDLATLERETTHRLWRELEDGSGSIFLLLTISGTTASETISDLAAHEDSPQERVKLLQRYSLMNSLQRLRDVGHLTVKVYRAQGLAAADLGGKSDPFCVLELVNSRLQTQTEYKTLAPNWQKIFTFNVKDINSVLEVTVYDEDRDHKVEFLGKVAIPLLRIRNGEKRWYALKDKKLRGRAKGNSPQILLEMTVVWNMIRACIRTLNPKEQKYMEPEVKFKRQVFLRNVFRLKAIIVIFIDIGKYVQSCWEWESKVRSIIAFVFFLFGCYYFEPYMIPVLALLILLKYYLLSRDKSGFNQWVCGQVALITGAPLTHHTTSHLHDPSDGISDDCPITPGDDDDDEDDKDKEEKKSLKERLQAIQEVTQIVQNSIGYIASLGERVKNLFNFTVPYLSYLAMLLAILGVAVLYFIPVRYLILLWGINKFSRKIVRPHSVPNNEVLDLVSRVPDDEELLNYRELKPFPTTDCEKGGSGSPGSSNMTRREHRKRHKAA